MLKDKFNKIILILILVFLGLNFIKGNSASPLLNIEAQAQTIEEEPQIIDLFNASGITCSADGKYVYTTGEFYDQEEKISNRECIIKSDNFGKPGSWKMVAKQKMKGF